MDNQIDPGSLLWRIPDKVKRIAVALLMAGCAVAAVFLFIAARRADQAAVTAALALKEQAAPYEAEINRIWNEMRVPLAAQENPYTVGTVLMGFLTEDESAVPEAGSFKPILVTQNPMGFAEAAAWNGMWKSGAAVLEYKEDTPAHRAELAAGGTTVLLRRSSTTVVRNSGTSAESRTTITVSPGVEDGVVTLPYLLINKDTFDMEERLEKMAAARSCLMLLFDVSALSGEKLRQLVDQVQAAVDSGRLKYSTIAGQEHLLRDAAAVQERREAEHEAYLTRQQERICQLQEQIREIYRGGR